MALNPNRLVLAPSNTVGIISGTNFAEDVNAEVGGLWQYSQVPLSNSAGAANAYTADCDVALDAYKKGQKFTWTPSAANTTQSVLNINNKGNLAVLNRDGSVLVAGRLLPTRMEELENDGVALRLMLDPPSSTTGLLRACFAYQTAVGVDSQASANGWSKYPLNTVIENSISGALLDISNNQFTLPPRTYEIVDFQSAVAQGKITPVLWNITDNIPQAGMARQPNYSYGSIRTTGRFNLSSAKTFELRIYTDRAYGLSSLGYALNINAPVTLPEQYGFIDIRSFG
jgi:hypothetical protein